MSDNLKEVKDYVALKIDNQRADLPILASEHKKILDDVLEKGGKYTGIPFRSVNDLSNGVLEAGEFSWNGNSMNETAEFDITISATSGDLNNITPIINLLSVGAIIKFKDFVGRSSLLEYQSHVAGVDSSNNDILTVTVKGYAENTNYLYVAGDNEICVLDFLNLAGGGEIEIQDLNGVSQGTTSLLQMGEGLSYEPATKTISSSYGAFYEKGVFNPYVSNYAGSETYSQNLQWARYVRVGDLVTISIRILSIVINTAPSDGIAIHDLPFAPYLLDTTTNIMVSGSSVDSQNLFGYIVSNKRLRLYAIPDGGIVSTTTAYFKPTFTSGLIDITASYLINSEIL